MKKLMLLILYMIAGFAVEVVVIRWYDLDVEGINDSWVILLVSIVIALIINVAMHELGHMIMGSLTHYQFVSYRLFRHVWYRDDDGRIRHQTSYAPGILGQALMKYPYEYSRDMPFFWYNIGGCLMNLLLAAVMIGLLAFHFGAAFNYFGLVFIYMSVYSFLENVVPERGNINDGTNIRSIAKDEKVKHAFYDQLKFVAEVTNKPVGDIDIGDYRDADLSVGMIVSNNLLNYYKMIDQGNYEEAFNLIGFLYQNLFKLAKYIRPVVVIEYMTMCVIHKHVFEIRWAFETLPAGTRNGMLGIREETFLRGAMLYHLYIKPNPKLAVQCFNQASKIIEKEYHKGMRATSMKLLDQAYHAKDAPVDVQPEEAPSFAA